MRRPLGIAVTIDNPDPHGHALLASVTGGRTHGRHTEVVAAWRQVLTEAGSIIPNRNIERQLRRTHIPVPTDDLRRIDIVAPCLNVALGLDDYITDLWERASTRGDKQLWRTFVGKCRTGK